MPITYDAEVDALCIRLLDGPFEVTVQRISDDMALNLALGGRVVGIEVLGAAENVFRPGVPPSMQLENLIPAVK